MSKTPGRPIFFIIPGTLFWVLVISGGVTGNTYLIGAGVVLMVVTIVVGLTLQIKAAAAQSARRRALWDSGTPARARVVSVKATGARINHDPEVELVLEVTLPDQPPHTVTHKAYVSQIAVPRVQPDCQLDVRVDPQDKSQVVVDPTITRG